MTASELEEFVMRVCSELPLYVLQLQISTFVAVAEDGARAKAEILRFIRAQPEYQRMMREPKEN